MTDEMKNARAQEAFGLVCQALENRNWTFDKFEDDLVVRFVVNGDDLPIQMLVHVQADKQLISVLSPLPFKMSENKRVEGAIAACAASFSMADGSFDYDMSTGGITFRQVVSYRDSEVGEGAVQYMLSCTCAMVDKYNDRFLALEKDMISIEKFISMD